MSSLIAETGEAGVIVLTDTLAVSPNGDPFSYTTKAFAIPHFRMIVACTGAGPLLGRWFNFICDRMIVQGIDHLNEYAADALADVWASLKNDFPIADGMTSTAYHFGFSEITGLIHAYAYRSTKDFQSELLQYGVIVKPECTISPDTDIMRDAMLLMNEQRRNQAALPADKRIYIGGEIQLHALNTDGFFIKTLDRFEDYEPTRDAIFANLQRKQRDLQGYYN